MRTLRLLPVLLAPVTVAPARAQQDHVATARELAIQGIELIEQGDCGSGAPLVDRAERLHHAVVHLQFLARCHENAGRLVAATEIWRRMLLDPVPPHATPAVHEAVAEARERLAVVLPKLARTTLRLDGKYPGLHVAVDGRPVALELLNLPQVMDPGPHRLFASAPGYSPLRIDWILPEGKSSTITIVLEPQRASESQTPPAPQPASEPRRSVDSAANGNDAQRASALPTVGWTSAAVGSATLVAGVVTWLNRDSRRDSLRRKCPNDVCSRAEFSSPENLASEKQTIADLTTATNVLLVSGGILLAGGVTLIVLGDGDADDVSSQGSIAVRLKVAPQGLSASGRF